MMTFSMAMPSAASVPGRRRRCQSARVATQFTRGSMLMSFAPRRIMSMAAWPNRPSPLDGSGSLPQNTMSSGNVNAGSS